MSFLVYDITVVVALALRGEQHPSRSDTESVDEFRREVKRRGSRPPLHRGVHIHGVINARYRSIGGNRCGHDSVTFSVQTKGGVHTLHLTPHLCIHEQNSTKYNVNQYVKQQ